MERFWVGCSNNKMMSSSCSLPAHAIALASCILRSPLSPPLPQPGLFTAPPKRFFSFRASGYEHSDQVAQTSQDVQQPLPSMDPYLRSILSGEVSKRSALRQLDRELAMGNESKALMIVSALRDAKDGLKGFGSAAQWLILILWAIARNGILGRCDRCQWLSEKRSMLNWVCTSRCKAESHITYGFAKRPCFKIVKKLFLARLDDKLLTMSLQFRSWPCAQP